MPSDVEIVTRGWEAVGRGDWDTLVADYTDDMVFVMPGQSDVLEGRAAWDRHGMKVVLSRHLEVGEMHGAACT